jgi:hypothetical protein
MTIFEYVIDKLIGQHPLPWRVDYDWTVEVYDARDALVIKLPNDALARELIAACEARQAANLAARAEVDALLGEHGVDG